MSWNDYNTKVERDQTVYRATVGYFGPVPCAIAGYKGDYSPREPVFYEENVEQARTRREQEHLEARRRVIDFNAHLREEIQRSRGPT